MSVAFVVGEDRFEIGTPSFAHAFFSTISAHAEPGGWGSRFPRLMDDLYAGELWSAYGQEARAELAAAHAVLVQLPPSAVVWDIADRSQRPPWGENIAPRITNLGVYFVTSTGQDLFATLDAAIVRSMQTGIALRMQ